jgi:hypothetical protein
MSEEEATATMTQSNLESNCIEILARQFRQFSTGSSSSSSITTCLATTTLHDSSSLVANSTSSHHQHSSWNVDVVVVTPEKKKKKSAVIMLSSAAAAAAAASSSSSSSRACLLPTADDPIDETFLMSLDSGFDNGRVNPVHVIVRRHIFEVRRTANTGRIFFQCACCKHRPRSERAKLSTVAPQSVNTIYRSFVRFMMQHVSACHDIPYDIRSLDARARKVANSISSSNNNSNFLGRSGGSGSSVGIKKYWALSAKRMGLLDGPDGKSIVYRSGGDDHHHLTAHVSDVSDTESIED